MKAERNAGIARSLIKIVHPETRVTGKIVAIIWREWVAGKVIKARFWRSQSLNGAWEIAGRISTIDLNDQLATANGVAGGRQTVYTAGLNWYVNRNVRFLFDYLHGDVARQISTINAGNAGSKFDAVAMRTQVAF